MSALSGRWMTILTCQWWLYLLYMTRFRGEKTNYNFIYEFKCIIKCSFTWGQGTTISYQTDRLDVIAQRSHIQGTATLGFAMLSCDGRNPKATGICYGLQEYSERAALPRCRSSRFGRKLQVSECDECRPK